MKERPILFNGNMVRAILEGRKTQTRRIITLPKEKGLEYRWDGARKDAGFPDTGEYMHMQFRAKVDPWQANPSDQTYLRVGCPYGFPGDRLWVRETWGTNPCYDYLKPSQMTRHSFCPDIGDGGYKASSYSGESHVAKWRPSIFMPRWASRITLEITEVRCQHLRDISEEDALAEGCKPHVESKWWQGYHIDDPLLHQTVPADSNGKPPDWLIEAKPYRDLSHLNRSAKTEFSLLWDSINAKRGHSWEKNPWVWALTFKRIK